MTWKASNLCHKPLYFEEVNLERYGHTAGPIFQPVFPVLTFFREYRRVAVQDGRTRSERMPIHAWLLYRPGDCAPWIVPPVPISLRGGLYQAAAVTGAFWLIP